MEKYRTEAVPKMEDLMPLIREQICAGRSVSFSPRGTSMLPMLRQGIDSVVLSPLPAQLQKYDLPLYGYPNGKYILHRIIGRDGDCYLCRGDNTYICERVLPESMIAVVTAFKRGEKRIPVDAWQYRLYCRIWVGTYPIRRFVKRGIGWLKRRILK